MFFILGGLGPTIAPFIVLPLKLGKKEFSAYLSRVIFRFRSGWISYAAGVLELTFGALIFLIITRGGLKKRTTET